ncbi:MAG TPA: hypothetical protein VJH90_01915 [archaeon]|nr:hypothetical protein [archaeon]
MIEWWASKTGVIIFIVILTGILLVLVGVENTSFKKEELVRNANNIALLIDSIGTKQGVTVYTIEGTGTFILALKPSSVILSRDGVPAERFVLSTIKNADVLSLSEGDVLVIEKKLDGVYVSKQ